MKTERVLVVALSLLLHSGCGARRLPPPDVAPPPHEAPRLSATRLVAFGDSITEGLLQSCPGTAAAPASVPADPPPTSGIRTTTPSGFSYPARLAALLHERYVGQPIEVINEGAPTASMAEMQAEFSRVLVGDGPDAVLLLVGSAEVRRRGVAAQADVVAGLQSMIRQARRRGLSVFVATLLPIEQSSCGTGEALPSGDDVILVNVSLRTMVGTEGATLVDLYEAFNGRTGALLGADGFHPSAQGYAVMARTFFEAVARQLEGE